MAVRRANGGLLALSLMLGGCAAIPGFGPAPVDVYDLTAPVAQVPRRLPRTQILVPEPTALKILDGEDIAIRTPGGAVQLLEGARWSDRLPRLVQSGLVAAYQHSGALGGVGRPGDGLAIDYQIIVEIRGFEVRPGGGQAVVELFVRVLNDRNGQVRASRSFFATASLAGARSDPAFVAALDRAFQAVAAEIVEWSIGVM
ncbi:ABC-type transport auxiliary lipoprotein family protein [Chelativorans sp. Marseille-P2723]|uniref:ABC-type transport auxiliary lipoprotein family protein n=1 Tax=Chelativorans sp. Marseille-P2723 TaxID=2709133 RepID=UPI001FEE937E|nr:ABC-type transport auxiliary lipoprotein family protein [Chelativorans sp. Marseille-P2723]